MYAARQTKLILGFNFVRVIDRLCLCLCVHAYTREGVLSCAVGQSVKQAGADKCNTYSTPEQQILVHPPELKNASALRSERVCFKSVHCV